RRRVDRGDEDQLAVLLAALRFDERRRNLRLVMAVGQQLLGRDAEPGADLHDRLFRRGTRDLDVGLRCGHVNSPSEKLLPADARGACHIDVQSVYRTRRIWESAPRRARLKRTAPAGAVSIQPWNARNATGREAYRSSTLLISTRFERTRST